MLLALAMMVGVSSRALAQGSTTASIAGSVKDNNGEALIGANVVVTHTKTGAKYGNIANASGRFRIPNVQVGGPYTVEVSFVGYEKTKKEGIYLTLGQTLNMTFILKEEATELEGVEITGTTDGLFDGNRTGAQTIVDEETLNSMPTVSRALADFARLNPQVSLGEGSDGFSISVAGQNNRYNTIYIDGAVNNDVFGLAGSGTNGGQTGVSPISVDAIEQLQVAVAPFDVRQSGFAGGSVNVVTRSGTNDFEGSVYYLFQNEGLAGDNPFTEEPLDEFTSRTYGARLGGPIVKDKLFFFASVEFQRDETPLPFSFEDQYAGDVTREQLDQLVDKLNGFGYDPGGFENNSAFLDSDKFLAKLDWNINDKNKLTARYSLTTADNREPFQSRSRRIAFQNAAESFLSETHSAAIELRSQIGQNMSNHLTLGYTAVRDDRDPSGDPFPYVDIDDSNGANIIFGSERFSTANLLNQDIFTITNNFEIYKGRHTITIGTHNEFYSVGNLFIPFNYGWYGYDNIDQFLNDEEAGFYLRSFSQVDNVVGDESDAIAEFNAGLLGFYVQDEFQVNENLKLTGGIRFDLPFYGTDVPVNEEFNTNTVTLLENAGYDLEGARTGQSIPVQLQVAPRFGFNWDVFGDQDMQVRGGIGIFTSRAPLVWVGGAYNNYGFNVGGVARFGGTPFRPDPSDQYPVGGIDPSNPPPSGDIDLFSEDFKLPQALKASIAVDKKLPWGMIGTLEYLHSRELQAISVDNINLPQPTENLTGTPDDRPIWDRDNLIDPTYEYIILTTNTQKGYANTFTAQLQKPFDNGFLANLSYTYNDAYSVFEGTSSQNSSNWRGLYNVDGRNPYDRLARNQFAIGHRIVAQASYRFDWAKVGFPNAATQVGIFYNGQSGRPFSYVYDDDDDDLTRQDTGGRIRSLIYVPRDQSEIILVEQDGLSPQQQWEALNSFIESDDYLSDIRGEYAERNGSRNPFINTLDFRFVQDFYIMTGNKRNTLQFTADIFNVLNFLNSDWGRIEQTTPFGDVRLIDFEGFLPDGTTPTFSYTGPDNVDALADDNFEIDGIRSSIWRAQIGIRYIFQ